MATKSKYRKLNLGPSEPITRRNTVQGMFVVGDYLDPVSNQRTLLLERPDVAAPPAKTVSTKRKARRPRTTSQPEQATSFPGVEAARG